jgi:hypothetical protein
MISSITKEDRMIPKEKKSINIWMINHFTAQMPESIDYLKIKKKL